jgi:hypothetical protein
MSDEQLEENGDVKDIITLKQTKVTVEDHELDCVISSSRDLQVYIPITQVCAIFDIDSDAQIRRIRRIPTLRKGLGKIRIKTTSGTIEQYREVYAISMMRLHSWLSGIDVSRTKTDSENIQNLLSFQENAADVLYGYFTRPLLPKDLLDESEDALPISRMELFKNLETARHAENMAEEANQEISVIKNRISDLEAKLHYHDGQEIINQKQAARLKQCITLIGYQLKRKNAGDYRTAYAKVYNEFSLTHYSLAEKRDYAKIKSFCLNWYVRLAPTGSKIPQAFTDPVEGDLGF